MIMNFIFIELSLIDLNKYFNIDKKIFIGLILHIKFVKMYFIKISSYLISILIKYHSLNNYLNFLKINKNNKFIKSTYMNKSNHISYTSGI